MAKYSNTVEYNITTKLDSSGISKLQTEIRQVENELREMQAYNVINPDKIRKAEAQLTQLRHLLNSSFNGRLGMFDLSSFQKGMKDAGLSVKTLGDSFGLAGKKGQTAFNSLIGRIGQIDTGIRSMSSTTNKIATTLGNTARWGVISTAFQSVLTGAHEATRYISDLDQSLTNIMMVTNYSREHMNEFARSANEAAKALGSTTTAYTDATLVFAQQGYDIPQSQQLANMSIKLANVSQQDSATTSDQITAYMNAYEMDQDMTKLKNALGKWAQVANDSAADVEELATATQKSASTAKTVGVSMDQLNATIATIESVTKDAPENIGNGLKTIYARFSDIKMGETLDDGVNLGQVTGALSKVGVNALDENGNMKEVGNILEELMGVWDGMDRTQKAAIATTLAGKYQLSRFEALMNRSDLYKQYLESSNNASAENMDEMYDDYLNSMEGKTKTLQASIEGLFTGLFNTDDLYGFIEGLTNVVNLFDKLLDSLGSSQTLLTGLGAIATKTFSSQIGQAAGNFIKNIQSNTLKKDNQKAAQDMVTQLGLSKNAGNDLSSNIINFARKNLQNSQFASEDQQKELNAALKETISLTNELINSEERLEKIALAANTAFGEELIKIKRNEQGRIVGVDDSEWRYKKAESHDKNTWKQAQQNLNDTSQLATKSAQLFAKGDMKEAIQQAEQLRNELIKDTDAQIKLNEAIEQYKNVSNNGTESTKQAENALNNLKNLLWEISEGTNLKARDIFGANVSEESGNIIDTYERLNLRTSTNRGMTENIETQKVISSITSVISSVGQLSFAWQSFQNLGSIWANEDLDYGEKVLQTIMNVSMALPMAVSALTDLKSSGELLIGQWIAMAEAELVETAATVEQIAADEALIIAQGGVVQSTVGAETAMAGQVLVEESLTAITWELAGAMASIVSPFLAVAATIGSLVLLGTELYKVWTKDADAAKQTSKVASELKQAYKGAKDEYENLKSSQSAYEDAKKALGELKVGTDEWNDALVKTNETVIGLLEKYPELAKYISRDKNGALTISSEGFDKIKEQQLKELNQIESNSLMASANAKQAEIKSNKTELSRRITAGTGFLSEDDLNKILNIADNKQSLTKDNIAEALGKNVSDPMVDAIYSKADEILAFLDKQDAAEEQTEAMLQQSASALLENNVDFKRMSEINGKEWSNAVISKVASEATEENSEYRKNAINSFDWSSGDSRARKYAELNGLTYDGEKDGNFVFKNKTGDETKISKDRMDELAIAAQAMSLAADNFNSISKDFSSITSSSAVKSHSGLSDSLLNPENSNFDLGNLGKTSLYQEMRTKDENGNEVWKSYEDSAELLGVTDDFAKQKGFEDAKAYIDSFRGALANSQKGFSGWLEEEDGLLKGSEIGQTGLENIGQESQDKVLKQIDTINKLDEAYEKTYLDSENYRKGLINLADSSGGLTEETTKLKKAEEKYNKVIEDSSSSDEDKIKAQEELTEAQEDLQDKLIIKDWKKAAEASKEYVESLSQAEEGSDEYVNACQNIADILSQVSDIPVSGEWVSNHLDLIKDWQNGVEGAASNLRVAIGQTTEEYSGQAEAVANNFGTTVDNINGALNGLKFNIDGEADFGSIFSQLGNLDDEMGLSEQQASSLASMLSSIGATELHFDQNGQLVTLDIQSIISQLNSGSATDKINGMVKLNQAVSAFKGNAKVTGKVPAAGTPQMTNPGSKGGGGSGGGGGGGGGGKSSSKIEDNTKTEIDIFQQLNEQLEEISADYDLIDKSSDRAFGESKIQDLQKMIDKQSEYHGKLKEELDLTEQQLELQRDLNGVDVNGKKSLASYGVKFDADGTINQASYEENEKRLVAAVNSFNGKDQEANKDAYEAAKEELENYREAIKDYESLLSQQNDLIAKIEDAIDTIEDTASEVLDTIKDLTDYTFEIKETNIEAQHVFDDINAMTKSDSIASGLSKIYSDMENLLDRTADDAYLTRNYISASGAYRAVEQNGGFKIGDSEYSTISEAIASGIDWGAIGEALSGVEYVDKDGTVKTVDSDFTNEQQQMIMLQSQDDFWNGFKEASEQLGEDLNDSADLYEDGLDKFSEAIDAMSDEIDKLNDVYDRVSDLIETRADQMDLLFGAGSDKATSSRIETTLLSIENYQNKLTNVNMEQKELASAQNKLLRNGTITYEELTLQEKELYDELQDKANDLAEEQRDIQSNIAEKMNSLLKDRTQFSVDSWIKNLTGGTDIAWLQEEWEMAADEAERYYDEVEKAYNIQSLQGKYQDLLDNASGLYQQQQITAQMREQLAYLRDKTNLSKYDVEYAQAQLEILQRTIALQDAQANKNKMKLRRDTQGNYSYVYTANETDVDEARQGLEEAQFNAYELSKEQQVSNTENVISALSELRSKLTDIMSDENYEVEERYAHAQEYLQYFNKKYNDILGDISTVTDNILRDVAGVTALISEENMGALSELYDTMLQDVDEFYANLDERFGLGVQNIYNYNGDIREDSKTLLNDLEKYVHEYGDEVDYILADMKTTYENIGSDIVEETRDAMEDAADATDDFSSAMLGLNANIINALSNLQYYKSVIEDTLGAYQDVINTATKIEQENAAREAEKIRKEQEEKERREKEEAAKKAASGSGGGGRYDVDTAYRRIMSGAWGNGVEHRVQMGANEGISRRAVLDAQNRINAEYGVAKRYAEGGYTGTWTDGGFGDNGKLAIVHPEELILNKNQAKDIFSVAELVSDMKAQALSIVKGNLLGQISPMTNDSFEQNVQIDATFPNASDANEIRSALTSLVDRAYQHSHINY